MRCATFFAVWLCVSVVVSGFSSNHRGQDSLTQAEPPAEGRDQLDDNFAPVADAPSSKHADLRGFSTKLNHKSAASAKSTAKKSSTSSCYYNLFLFNYDAVGYGGGTFSVSSDSGSVLDSATLPTNVKESGWTLSVSTGDSLTFTYSAGESSTSTNGFFVTDVNGNKVLNESSLSADSTFTVSDVSCECVYPSDSSECPSIRVRNEWRSLTYCEKQNVISALNKIRWESDPDDGANLYDKFVVLHYVVTLPLIAAHNLLLPWHRMMLWQFEEDIRAMGGQYSCLSIPYWDWTLDFGNESTSSLYDDLGGMNYDSCITEPFAEWTNPVLNGQCVTRRQFANGKPYNPAFTALSAVQFGVTTDSNYTFIFRYMVRAPHKAPHMFIGGDMKSFASPADPLFWLHHANVDRMWAMWQDCWEFDKSSDPSIQYDNIGATTPYTLMPRVYPSVENSTIASSFNITALGYHYTSEVYEWPQLNQNQAVTNPTMCQWDWFSRSKQDLSSLSYRIPVHTDYQRDRLSTLKKAYYLSATTSGNYYSALISELALECELADASGHDQLVEATGDPLPGPSYLFNNLCHLLELGAIDKLWFE